MKEKEKFKAEIESRLRKFDHDLKEIKMKLEQAKENVSELNIDEIMEKHKKAESKLAETEQTDESSWGKLKSEIDDLVSDIDNDMRKAITYFK
jgi:predicted  nucleic acid-binding Zn-ribbon protein